MTVNFDRNLPLLVSIVFLLSLSILVIFSSSKELAIQQSIFAAVGIFLFFLVSNLDYRYFNNAVYPLYAITLILLLIVFILGIETRGSVRWIPLGFFNIQPSEIAKPVLILLLAQFWSKNLPVWSNIFKSLLWVLPITILVFKQPDLGTTLTILAIWVGMLFASKVSFKKILVLMLILITIIPISWFVIHDYQKQRIISFLSPAADPLGVGYNLIQSTIAVGSGQIFGQGLGRGTQSRLQFLPEYKTDFIFASIAEELGLFGSLILLGLYFFIIAYSLKQVEQSLDYLGFLIIFGVISMLGFQVIINIGMNVGLFPITGITLPLISYGGSSLISTLVSLGFIASVIRINSSHKNFA